MCLSRRSVHQDRRDGQASRYFQTRDRSLCLACTMEHTGDGNDFLVSGSNVPPGFTITSTSLHNEVGTLVAVTGAWFGARRSSEPDFSAMVHISTDSTAGAHAKRCCDSFPFIEFVASCLHIGGEHTNTIASCLDTLYKSLGSCLNSLCPVYAQLFLLEDLLSQGKLGGQVAVPACPLLFIRFELFKLLQY